MDHIFGNHKFQLKELYESCNWMKTTEAEEAFFNSRLVTMSKEQEEMHHCPTAQLLPSSAQCLKLLKYVQGEYSDIDV